MHALLDVSVAQIHAPQAWAAGFDGTGAKVAVLDTGYDPTHPDLAGRVTGTSNFTTDPASSTATVTARTSRRRSPAAARRREASTKAWRRVPSLMVGKVLGNDGIGEDSWVLAGMQWAVASGADVVNMSLGGDAR